MASWNGRGVRNFFQNMSRLPTFVFFCLLMLMACRPGQPVASDRTETLTFFVSGLECVACAESVRQSISGLEGIESIRMREGMEGYAQVCFAPEIVSAQQIAQAVHEARPLHGTPYEATLRLQLPGQENPSELTAVKTLLANQKHAIEAEPFWDAADQILLRFLPLEKTAETQGAKGWGHERLSAALSPPAPSGPGLKNRWVSPDDPSVNP